MKKNIIKKALAITGILTLLGWLGVTDEVIGSMLFALSLLIALILHLFTPKVEVNVEEPKKVGESTIEVQEVPKEPEPPQKTPQEIEAAELREKLAELEKKPQKNEEIPEKTVKLPEKPLKKEKKCQFCEKVCRNETDYKRHIAFKHFDKIKLDVGVE